MNEAYKKQVRLLLNVLPEVAKEECYAMHGGTAINFFVRDMPRLSVDIDLTYVEIAERTETFDAINAALVRIKERIESLRSSIGVQYKMDMCKLQVDEQGVVIKVEVNRVNRGLLDEATKAPLCKSTQEQFDAFCTMPIVSMAQLYGGKICAALDRQHPRDLFDVRLLFQNEGFTDDIKGGMILALLNSNRPTYEMLDSHLLDQRSAFNNQFEGMSALPFSYDDYEATRDKLIGTLKARLNKSDKAFLLNFNRLEPDWSVYDYQEYPSVKWKLLNLERFKRDAPDVYQQQLSKLEGILEQ